MLAFSQKDFFIGNVSYGSKIQVYYVNQQCCSGALISQIKLIKSKIVIKKNEKFRSIKEDRIKSKRRECGGNIRKFE